MKVIKLPLEKKYCKICQKELPEDWDYDECSDCLTNNTKKTQIIKGILAGGLILSIAAGIYQATKIIRKGND